MKMLNVDNNFVEQTNSKFDQIDCKLDLIIEIIGGRINNDTQPIYLTVKETHKLLRISRRTLYRWIETGKIKPVQMPGSRSLLFPKQEILNKLK